MIIFSDIDGTFIDENYRCPLDRHYVESVFREFQIVFVSSRTVDEIVELNRVLKIQPDFIAENGGVFVSYCSDTARSVGRFEEYGDVFPVYFASKTETILPDIRKMIGDLDIAPEIIMNDAAPDYFARRNHYSLEDARRSLHRSCSVLLDISGLNEIKSIELKHRLIARGLTTVFGGKWLAVLHGSNKGTAIRHYMKAIQTGGSSIGIGNSENDLDLLNAVDKKFVIQNAYGFDKSLLNLANAVYLQSIGCEGWKEMIQTIESEASNGRH